jgi:cellulose synthase/poly-beta-1,6-N-acetylglucosamine synthase-like glycosyltransferase
VSPFILLLGLVAAYLGIVCGYLLLLTYGAFALRKKVRTDAPPLRIAVVIPAHNEELQIENSVRCALEADYDKHNYSVFVIADNCHDRTAELAREAGATAFERHDTMKRGKGQALDWLFTTQAKLLEKYDAIAIVDADTRVDPNFLKEISASLSHPDVRVVQGFHGVSNPAAHWRTALTFAGFALVNGLRPAGRSHWGGTAELKGNGMAFRSNVLLHYGWPAHSIVEDIEFSTRLLLDDVLVHFNPDAIVISEMPSSGHQAEPQRRRWESGRIQTIQTYLPRLFDAFLRRPSWRLLDAMLEMVVPPLTILVSIEAAGFVLSLFAGLEWAAVFVVDMVITAVYVCAGLYCVSAPREAWTGLLAAPLFIAWKVPFYFRLLLSRPQQTWERTQRDAEAEREDPGAPGRTSEDQRTRG